MVTIIVNNTRCKILNLIDPDISKDLDNKLSYAVQGFQFMRVSNNWDGRHRLLTKTNTFPVGMLSEVKKILNKHRQPFQIQDNRLKVVYGSPIPIDPHSGFVPRDYQQVIVDKGWAAGGGIVRLATGGGKTGCIAMLAARFNVKVVVYVIGIELLYQMKETFEWLYPKLKIGMVGDGNCDIQDITIATIWTASAAFDKKADIIDSDLTPDKKKAKSINKPKIRKMVQEAELFILDECQYAGSSTVQFLHSSSVSARHRFLFSGTPWRESGDDILIESVGGPKFYDMSASMLIRRGYLVKPKIYFLEVPPMRGVGKTYPQVYKNFIQDNETRNDLIVQSAKRMVERGRKVLVLVTKVAHGKHLLSLLEKDLRVSSLDGSNKTADRMKAIQDMKDGNLDILIASKIFDQGIDIPDLDGLILAGSGKSSARALQRIGRVIRRSDGKKDAIVVDFIDNCKYLREHSKARRGIYNTESEFELIMPKK